MPCKDHAIERWTCVIRKLLQLKAPTRRGAPKQLGRRIDKAVAAYLYGGRESEKLVEEVCGWKAWERPGSLLGPSSEFASEDVAASSTSLYHR